MKRGPVTIDKDITPAKFKITIPAKFETAADQGVPKSKQPLQFALVEQVRDAELVYVHIAVGNESTDVWPFPFRGDTAPWHRSNWYQLEVDGKIVKPAWNEREHPDGAGKFQIVPMQRRFAHTLKIVPEKAKDRKFDKNDYFPLYVLPEGEHTLRVIPSPLWAEQKIPVPVPASIRIRVGAAKSKAKAGAMDLIVAELYSCRCDRKSSCRYTDAHFDVVNTVSEMVQETYLCPEFERRAPGTGYRG